MGGQIHLKSEKAGVNCFQLSALPTLATTSSFSCCLCHGYELEKSNLLGLLLWLYIFLLSSLLSWSKRRLIALYPYFFFFLLVAGKDAQCGGERKENLLLLQIELGVRRGLNVHSCSIEVRLKGSEGFMVGEGLLKGEFQEWSRLRKDHLEVSLSQVVRREPRVLGGRRILLPVWVGRGHVIHSCLGQLLSTFLIITLGDLLLGARTENLPSFNGPISIMIE